eukprot:10154652-Alexandrium_andersonii.AAC.1
MASLACNSGELVSKRVGFCEANVRSHSHWKSAPERRCGNASHSRACGSCQIAAGFPRSAEPRSSGCSSRAKAGAGSSVAAKRTAWMAKRASEFP